MKYRFVQYEPNDVRISTLHFFVCGGWKRVKVDADERIKNIL